jgi:hypothetical protein
LLQLGLDCDKLIACFHHYLTLEGHPITRANAEERMLKKLNQSLTEDIAPLLPTLRQAKDRSCIGSKTFRRQRDSVVFSGVEHDGNMALVDLPLYWTVTGSTSPFHAHNAWRWSSVTRVLPLLWLDQ